MSTNGIPPVHELTYGQSWRSQLEPDFNPGKVSLHRHGDILKVEAVLTDRDIHDPPAAFNDEAYRSGDVFELFIKAEGDTDYHEFHVTPSNVLLQLRFTIGQPLDVEASKIWQPLLTSSVELFPEGWIARFDIPLSGLTPQRPLPALWKIACGRYDYIPDAKEGRHARISNTAPLTIASFHRHGEWPIFDLGQG